MRRENGTGLRKGKQKKKEELCDCAVGFKMRGGKKKRERGREED